MRDFWSCQTLRFLAVTIAASGLVLAGNADPVPAVSLPEAPANELGVELPLLPGERLVPTARDCSVVVYAPHQERYDRFAAYWSTAEWIGECRFGLAHAEGTIAGIDGSWSVETTMLYGLEINPDEITKSEIGDDGAISWNSTTGTLNYFSGAAFSDPKATRYIIRLDTKPSGDLELGDMASDWYGTDYLEKHTFNKDGREWTASVSVWNVDTYCGLGLPPEFKPHEKEVKKACRKNGEQLVLFRREGFSADIWADRPITWLRSCPMNKASRENDCGKLVRAALSKEAAELEALLADGDAAARSAAEQEIIDRYRPLEEAFEAPVLVQAAGDLHDPSTDQSPHVDPQAQ